MSNLLLDEKPLVILPQLAVAVGLNEAIVLQQIHYWMKKDRIGKVHDSRKWVRNTYGEWQKNFPFWSESTVRRALNRLRDEGLILVARLNDKAYDKTNWYTIDYDRLSKMTSPSVQNDQMDLPKMNTPIPETTTETTTETTSSQAQAPAPSSSTDPSDFTISELKELKRTRSEWEQMLEKEQEGEDRKGAKEYMEDKLWGAKHPAIVIYHEVMDRYPRQNQYRDTIKRVEESGNLELWREIVRAWKMHGWNPYNLAGMLECLEDGRIPSTGNGGSNGRHHDRNRSSTGSKRGTPPLPAGRTRPWTAKELAWIQREQELAAEGKLG